VVLGSAVCPQYLRDLAYLRLRSSHPRQVSILGTPI